MTQPETQPRTQPDPRPPIDPASPANAWRVLVWIVAAVTVGVVLIFGTISVVGYFMLQTETRTTSFPNAVTRVQVTNTNGHVKIRTGTATPGATVISRSQNSFRTAKHSEAVTNGVLQVSGSCEGGFFVADACSMDFDITVPKGTTVEARTTTGDISVIGTGAAVTATSSTGDLRVTRAGGAIRLTTNVGNVIGVDLPGGTVQGRSNTGDVELEFTTAPDRITATTNVGDVRVVVPDDATTYQATADTDIGDRHLDIPIDPRSEHIAELSTNTGDVWMTSD